MSDQHNAPRFGCPQCGSERIDEQNLVPFHYPVTAWTEDGEPADYGERREIEEGAEIEEVPYWCNGCHHTFLRPVRLDVEPAPTFPATGPRFGCPSCKSENITGDDFVLRRRRVERWTEDGKPEAYGSAHIETDSALDDLFTCEDCGKHFLNPVRLDPEPDAEEEARREHRRAAKERGTL